MPKQTIVAVVRHLAGSSRYLVVVRDTSNNKRIQEIHGFSSFSEACEHAKVINFLLGEIKKIQTGRTRN